MTKFQIFLMALVMFLLGIFVAQEYERGNTAQAEMATSIANITAFSSNLEVEDTSLFYVIDPEAQKILMYKNKLGEFLLVGARSFKYDTWCDDTAKANKRWQREGLTVKEMRDAQEKAKK